MSASVKSHRIRTIAVLGGFLDGARFDLADGLNCFIGARGTGKTTALEFVRYALDALPPRESQSAERRRLETLVEKNLGGGHVEVTIETKEGLTYIVSRAAGEDPIVLTEDRQPTDMTLKAGAVFRANIYSQNEVESIADRANSQLELIDNFEATRIAEIEAQLEQVCSLLTGNANQIVPLQSRLASLTEEIATLAKVEERLKEFANAGGDGADSINEAHKLKAMRDRERCVVTSVEGALKDLGRDLSQMSGRLVNHEARLRDEEILNGPNGILINEVFAKLRACATEVDRLLQSASAQVAQAASQVSTIGIRLSVTHKRQELDFRNLIEKHQHAQGQAAERSQLEKRRNELLDKSRQRQQLVDQLRMLEANRASLLQQQSELWDERFAVRESVANRVNAQLSPYIRVQVSQFGNPERYQELLEEGLKGARLKHGMVAQKLANVFWPAELASLVRSRDLAQIAEKAELNPDQAAKVLAALSSSSFLFELETVELFDLPRIELKDGENYKETPALSTGQKCTAILPILLLDSDNPLLVDQPEDNLDNRFIFEAIVESIRKVKQRRQMIFVTHNPNIPVLGDAERVFVLDSNGESGRKANEGTVDECKADIVTLLEGGEDAFKARKCRYAY